MTIQLKSFEYSYIPFNDQIQKRSLNKFMAGSYSMEENLKEKIRDTALELFKKISYAKTSVSDIANETGIGKGTIYLYYKSKEEILTDIMNEKIAEINTKKLPVYFNNELNFEEKLQDFISFLTDTFLEMKTLLFGSFDNIKGKIIKDVFSSYNAHKDDIIVFLSEIIIYEKIDLGLVSEQEKNERLGEFFHFMLGRITLYVLETDWDNIEPVKIKLQNVCYRLFNAIVLQN